MKQSAVLFNPQQAHAVLASLWASIKAELMAGHRLTVKVEPEKRSSEQNKRLWAMLTDISEQVEWHGVRLSPEDWKAVFTAAMKRNRIVPGIDGGFVVLGQSTSKMTKAEFSELIELIDAFGAERGVNFKEQT